MEFKDVILKRRSIRKYKNDAVSKEDLEYVLEAAKMAPSWANLQCWQFIVITDPAIKDALAKAGNEWIAQAPVIIVVCGKPEKSGQKDDQDYYMLDAGIAMEHLILAAADRGLGTCWIGAFDENIARSALGVPDDIRIVASTPLGYPDQKTTPISRKPLTDIVSYNKYIKEK